MSLIVILFKQKTAYDVRISDWSSDVCSSDLADCPGRRRPVEVSAANGHPAGSGRTRRGRRTASPAQREPDREKSTKSRDLVHVRQKKDRKSDVSGKSVSVRVDLGGRSNIKKKKTRIMTETQLQYKKHK